NVFPSGGVRRPLPARAGEPGRIPVAGRADGHAVLRGSETARVVVEVDEVLTQLVENDGHLGSVRSRGHLLVIRYGQTADDADQHHHDHDLDEGEAAGRSRDIAHPLIVARGDRRSQVLLRPTRTYLFFPSTSAGSTASGPNLRAISSRVRLRRSRFFVS